MNVERITLTEIDDGVKMTGWTTGAQEAAEIDIPLEAGGLAPGQANGGSPRSICWPEHAAARQQRCRGGISEWMPVRSCWR